MSTIHKVIISSNDRISGTASNFVAPIRITQLENLPKVKSVQLEWTSIIVSTAPLDVFVSSDSLSIPQSWQSNRTNDINVLGVIPYQDTTIVGNLSTFVYFAQPASNLPVPVSNAEGIIKSGMINIRLVDRLGDEYAVNQEYSLALLFS